jgi:hypothetical protein
MDFTIEFRTVISDNIYISILFILRTFMVRSSKSGIYVAILFQPYHNYTIDYILHVENLQRE